MPTYKIIIDLKATLPGLVRGSLPQSVLNETIESEELEFPNPLSQGDNLSYHLQDKLMEEEINKVEPPLRGGCEILRLVRERDHKSLPDMEEHVDYFRSFVNEYKRILDAITSKL